MRREFRSTFRDSARRVGEGHRRAASTRAAHPQPCIPEVSVDRGVAEDLKLALGDTITWDVQGVRVPTRVTSFREVNWTRFEPNFFVVFERRALGRAEAVRAARRRARPDRGAAPAARRREPTSRTCPASI